MSQSLSHTSSDVSIIQAPFEVKVAYFVGEERHSSAMVKGLCEAHGANRTDSLKNHVVGAMAEAAVAKALNIYWDCSVDVFNRADLQPDIGVRSTPYDHGHLIIHNEDPDDRRFVLATGDDGHFVVRGWMIGRDAKQPKWWRTPNNRPSAFWVPQSELRPICELEVR
jgi:hypothetical protein